MPSEKPDDIDYDYMGHQLSKAGIPTKNDIEKIFAEQLQGLKSVEPKTPEEKQSIEEIIYHLEGKCGQDCELSKFGKDMVNRAYTTGAYRGIKIGGKAAQRGIYIE